MNEKPTPQEPAQTPASGENRAPLSDRKRNALLRYMAILFGVAFLMVLLSLLIQMRDSRETISDLNQSKAGALEKAEQLQDENQQLAMDNNALRTSIQQLQTEQKDLTEELEEARRRQEDDEALRKQLEQDLQSREETDDLLAQAAALYLAGDRDAGRTAMEAVTREELTQQGQALYDQLQKALDADTAETAE